MNSDDLAIQNSFRMRAVLAVIGILRGWLRGFIGLAGLPLHTIQAGWERMATARAPITAPSPICTPGPTKASVQIQASAPIVIGLAKSEKEVEV